MIRVFAAACFFLLAAVALAQDPERSTLRVDETQTIEIPGATAAYAIDPNIADATVTRPGVVSVTGHAAGTTQVIAVTATGTKSYVVTVGAPQKAVVPAAVTRGGTIARAESRYSSSAGQFQNVFDVFRTDGDRRSQIHAMNVHYLRDTFGRPSRDAFPSVFYRVTTPGREMIFLDDQVDLSPLTIRSTQLRGLHLRQGPLELHGGYAASSLYEDLFLPADRRWVAGASYALGQGDLRWIPSVYGFFSEPEGTAARRGVVGTIAAEYQPSDALFTRGELGFGPAPAASVLARYDSPDAMLRARAWYKPEDFPTLALADIPGTHGELDWSGRASKRLTVDSYATFDRTNFAGFGQTVGVTNLALRYALTKELTALGGADASIVRRDGTSLRTIGIPAGLSFDLPSFGASATYRLLDTTNTARRGDTLRLAVRGTIGPLRLNAWAERQREAPTLELIFRSQPGLELALLRLGISVHTPEDLARVLRDNAALINLGFIEGVTVDLTPRRRQAGLDASLLTFGARDQIRLHAVYDRIEGVSRTLDSALATLTYSRRLFTATDLYASYTWWRTGTPGLTSTQTAYELGLRQRFDGVPRFLQRSSVIEGVVFLDPSMTGTRGADAQPLADITVALDAARTVRTDKTGRYVFRDVPPGPHRVAAQLPADAPAFFTTPSRAEVEGAAKVDFGLVWTPARIAGRVLSDANLGIAGVVVSAALENGKAFTATTDSDGGFALSTPPGAYKVTIAPESLPPGYTMVGEGERTAEAAPDRPQTVGFEVRALRSVAGTAPGATEVRIPEIGRTAATDAEGHFVFRSLPAGTFTLTARNGSTTITLPAEPTMLRDVTLGTAVATPRPTQVSAAAEPQPTPRPAPQPAPVPTTSTGGAWRVQVGAYRLAENAAEARARLQHLGYQPEVTRSGALQIVSVGPYASSEIAEREAAKLEAARIPAIVVGARAATPTTVANGGTYFVQVGAFREASNARQLTRRISALGQKVRTVLSRGLTLVSVGPFPTRRAASNASEQLRKAGFDTVVTAR